MLRNHSSILRSALLGLLILAVALPAVAQRPSRVALKVIDPNEELIEGVEVVAINEAKGVEERRTTDRKGKVLFAFREAVDYELTASKEGYDTVKTNLRPETGAVKYMTLTLYPAGAAADAAAPPPPAASGEVEAKLSRAEETFNQGVALLQQEDFDGAKAKFLEALDGDSDLHVAHSALASIYLEQNDLQNALTSAQAFVAAAPGNPRGQRLLYETYQRLGDEAAAEAALAKLGELQSGEDAVALVYNEGAEAVRVGDMARARERLERALSMNADLKQAMKLLSIVYFNDGEHEAAVAMAERYIAIEPGDSKVLKLRWDALTQLGDTARADAAYAELVAADPTALAQSLYEDGRRAFDNGDTATALSTLQKAIEADPNHARSWYFLGLSHVNTGNSAEAREALEKFIALAPDDPQIGTAREMLTYLN